MAEWKELFNGADLTGWRMRHTEKDHAWEVKNGILVNTASAVDIVTEANFGDFELQKCLFRG